MHNTRGIRGFTYIELLIAAGVVAVLLAIAFPVYQNYITESRTSDALNTLKALELEVRAPAEATDSLHSCDDSLVSAQNLQSDYLDLTITAAPNDLSNPNGPLGFGAVLDVKAQLDQQGRNGIRVAEMFYAELKGLQPDALIDGVITDSVVAFAVRLSPSSRPFCDNSQLARQSGATAPASRASNRPPVAGQQVSLGSTLEDTPLTINTSQLISASWDPDRDPLTISSITTGSGSVTGDAVSGYTYTPPADFHGTGVMLSFEVSDGVATSSGTATVDVVSVVDEPNAGLVLSAAQQIMDTGSSGRAVVSGLQTGGDMDAFTLEFSVVGQQGGDKGASTGPVIFNYGTASNNNVISAWRPSNFTIALAGKDWATGINIADGNNHRVTVSWESATGILKVFDNGQMVKQFDNVGKGTSIPGSGHLVIGQKMNNPGSGGGWNSNEHYSGQVFGTTLASQAYPDQDIAGAPLYSRNQGIVADLRSEGSGMVDQTGKHQVSMQGDFSTSTVLVDTALALIPPGSEVRLSITATPGDSDSQVTAITVDGLAGLTISDGTRQGSGSVDVTGWDLSQLRTVLPAGFKRNLPISLTVEASDGTDASQITVTQVLRMEP